MTVCSFLNTKQFAPKANLLFSTRFADITINDPDTITNNGTVSTAWSHIVGTDSMTGYSYTDLAAAPLYIKPAAGGGTTGNGGYGIYQSTRVGTPAFATSDRAGVEAVFPKGVNAKTIFGASLKELYSNVTDTGTGAGYQTQNWLLLYRYLQAEAADLNTFCIKKWITRPDQSDLLSSVT